jgi:hypothetical protein
MVHVVKLSSAIRGVAVSVCVTEPGIPSRESKKRFFWLLITNRSRGWVVTNTCLFGCLGWLPEPSAEALLNRLVAISHGLLTRGNCSNFDLVSRSAPREFRCLHANFEVYMRRAGSRDYRVCARAYAHARALRPWCCPAMTSARDVSGRQLGHFAWQTADDRLL